MAENDNTRNNPDSNQNKSPIGKPAKGKFNFYWIYGLLAVIFFIVYFVNSSSTAKKTDWRDLKDMLQSEDVEKIVLVNRETAEIYIKEDRLSKVIYEDISKQGIGAGESPHYYYEISSPEVFDAKVEDAQEGLDDPIYIDNENRRNWGFEPWARAVCVRVCV